MLLSNFCTPLVEKKLGEIRSECKYTKRQLKEVAKLYWKGLLNLSTEKTQFFDVLKCK